MRTVERLLRRCRKEPAKLVLVEFWDVFGWRKHGPLLERLEASRDLYEPLYPDRLDLDEGASPNGQTFRFDPAEHFRAWRVVEDAHAASKPDRRAELAQAIAERQGHVGTLKELAAALNAEGLKSPTGKPWTADNLRKFMKGL